MNIINKFLASIIGSLLFVLPLIIQIFVTDLFGFIFFGQTVWSYALILESFSMDMGSISTLISTIIHLILSIIVSYIYFKKVKKDKLKNTFSVLSLLIFYFVQFFMIHQICFGVISLVHVSEMDANDFMGVISFGFYSSFLYVVFGIIIDFIKNKNGIPQVKL